jgi:hypothetical protein
MKIQGFYVKVFVCMITDFRRGVEKCQLVDYYAANSDNLLPTFRDC